MIRVIGRRLIEAVITLLLFSMLVFAATRVLGDPVVTLLGPESTAPQRAEVRKQLNLDEPVVTQYWHFLSSTVQGDLGESLHTQVPVWESIKDRAPPSLLLAVTAMLVALVVAVPLGVLSATRKGKVADSAAKAAALVGQGTPSFLLGMLAVWLFALKLGWLPAGGLDGPKSLILPAVVLAWFIGAGVFRLLRSSLIDVLQSDFVLFARSAGLPRWRVVWFWALPNAMVSVIAFIGYMFGAIIAGAIVIEAVFVWPGLGRLAYEAVVSRDLLLIQGTVLVIALLMILSNLLVDLIQIAIDPRVRHPRSTD